jgi:hypothetical protein
MGQSRVQSKLFFLPFRIRNQENLMRFGLFGSAQSSLENLGARAGWGFHDYIDYNVEAEALSYYSTFLVERHFTGWPQISATLNFPWRAARPKTVRVGTAV